MDQTRLVASWLRSIAYAMGMIVAIMGASSFVIGGMLAGAKGFAALLLAAAVPAAALTWAVALSILDTSDERSLPIGGRNHSRRDNERGGSLR